MRIALSTIRTPRPARPLLAAIALWTALLAAPSWAHADTGQTIINRCIHGQSLTGFTQQEYHRALQELGTEVEEYSNCASLIRAAQFAGAAGHTSARAVVATPLSPAERTSIARVRSVPAGPLRVGGETLQPGVVRANIASAVNSLPSSLLAVLALMLACAAACFAGVLRNLVRRRNHS
jgi:hypothetical protein